MYTYFIADNKTRYATIYQSNKTREQVIDSLMFSKWDICITCDTVEHAQDFLARGNYTLINIDDFRA